MAGLTLVSADNLLRKDHTPGSAVAAGDVLSFGTAGSLVIAERPIAANAVGCVIVRGGIWRGPVIAGTSTLDVGTKVYWDEAGGFSEGTHTDERHFGQVITAGAEGDEILAEFNPNISKGVTTPP